MSNAPMETEHARRLHKVLRNSAGGLILAGGAVYGIAAAPGPPPFGLAVDRLKQWGLGLVGLGLITGASWVVIESVAIWRVRAALALARGEGAPGQSLVSLIRSLRFRWPFYSAEAEDGVLENARSAAQAEAMKQITAERAESDKRLKTAKDFADVVLSAAKYDAESERAEKIRLQEELDGLRQLVAGAQNDGKRYFQQLRYGRLLMEESVFDTHEYAAMRQSLQRLKPSLDRLLTAADKTWTGMIRMAEGIDPKSALSWLLWCFKNYPSVYSVSAMRAFVEFVDSDRDPRPYLAAGYMAYTNWREWLLRLVAMLQLRPDALPGYADWLAAENEFLHELELTLSISLLDGVSRQLAEYGANARKLRFPPPMPVAFAHSLLTRPPSAQQGPGGAAPPSP